MVIYFPGYNFRGKSWPVEHLGEGEVSPVPPPTISSLWDTSDIGVWWGGCNPHDLLAVIWFQQHTTYSWVATLSSDIDGIKKSCPSFSQLRHWQSVLNSLEIFTDSLMMVDTWHPWMRYWTTSSMKHVTALCEWIGSRISNFQKEGWRAETHACQPELSGLPHYKGFP